MMKGLTVELNNAHRLGHYGVFIDGNCVLPEKGEGGKLVCKYQTEKDSAKIQVVRYLDCGGIWWFITQILFFIISIFGLADRRGRNRSVALDFSAEVETADFGYIVLDCAMLKDGEKAFTVKSNTQVMQETNEYYTDEQAKKTFKKLFIAKIITAAVIVAAIITTVLVIIL